MKLIDADVALKDLENLKKSPWYHFDNPFVQQGMRECMEVVEAVVIEDAPTVDAVPVEYILKQIVKLERSKGQSYPAICYRHLLEVWQMENERREE